MRQASAEARRALIIAGPTASGKSALALALALRYGGTVINADSMQVYRELRILTARPSPADEAAAPHALYGVRPAAEPGSVAWWRGEALASMAAARLPILCGGTGMYLQALTAGLADIPQPDPAAREEARALLQHEGPSRLHARLAVVDPATACGLCPSDGQRLARAWEVWRSSGRGLAAWQQSAGEKPPYSFLMILLEPPRDALRASIASRFDNMIAAGALGEVAALLTLGLDPSLPAMRALGVPELGAVLRGSVGLSEARDRAVASSQRYVKRQATWFRNRVIVDPVMKRTINARFDVFEQLSESVIAETDAFIS